MKRTLRTGLCLILALGAALPASAQNTSLAVPIIPRAQKGETVTVSLKDGREITGVVGNWLETVGFYVKPADSVAYLIHPDDIVSLLNTNSRAMRGIPERKGPPLISRANVALIAVGATLGALFLLAHMLPQG